MAEAITVGTDTGVTAVAIVSPTIGGSCMNVTTEPGTGANVELEESAPGVNPTARTHKSNAVGGCGGGVIGGPEPRSTVKCTESAVAPYVAMTMAEPGARAPTSGFWTIRRKAPLA